MGNGFEFQHVHYQKSGKVSRVSSKRCLTFWKQKTKNKRMKLICGRAKNLTCILKRIEVYELSNIYKIEFSVFVLMFYGPASTIKVMSSRSLRLSPLVLDRLPKRLTSSKCPYFRR